jgi:hypothetical protein
MTPNAADLPILVAYVQQTFVVPMNGRNGSGFCSALHGQLPRQYQARFSQDLSEYLSPNVESTQ